MGQHQKNKKGGKLQERIIEMLALALGLTIVVIVLGILAYIGLITWKGVFEMWGGMTG